MSGAAVGFFGKLPSHGDFIERRVAASFKEVWDAWLQRSISASRDELGSGWLDCYLTSPLWRFFLSDGIAGAASYAGVLLPSVDRVGRYFPLTVVAELPAGLAPLAFARAADRWFEAVEQLCTQAMQDTALQLDGFDASLSATADKLAGADRAQLVPDFPTAAAQWRWPIRSVRELSRALIDPLMSAAERTLRPLSMWWTAGSELVQPSVLLLRSLPSPDSFAALLAGRWDDGRWQGVTATGPPPEEEAAFDTGVRQTLGAAREFSIVSGGVTDVGMVRSENQDNLLLADGNRLWAVADGLGGQRDGGIASQMVVDALNNLAPAAGLNAAQASVDEALARVNADLRRGALGVGGGEGSGSTVVTLLIRGDEWLVQWAGDSRAYRYRDGELLQLTHDHNAAAEFDPDETAVPLGSRAELTRAVGGDDYLELDRAGDRLHDGDRFLLCSDGLYGALDEPEMSQHLALGDPQQSSQALIDAARAAGARDNVTAVIVDVHGLTS